MALLSQLLNWFISLILNRFIPRVRVIKQTPWVPTPTLREDNCLVYNLFAPESLTLEPHQRQNIDMGLIFKLPPYLSMHIWDQPPMERVEGLCVFNKVSHPMRELHLGLALENKHPSRRLEVPKGVAIAQMQFYLTTRTAMTVTEREVKRKVETEMSESDFKERDGCLEKEEGCQGKIPGRELRSRDP